VVTGLGFRPARFQREIERERDVERDRDRETDVERERSGLRVRVPTVVRLEREIERERARERDREIERETERETERACNYRLVHAWCNDGRRGSWPEKTAEGGGRCGRA
jgi:hypothetical protein